MTAQWKLWHTRQVAWASVWKVDSRLLKVVELRADYECVSCRRYDCSEDAADSLLMASDTALHCQATETLFLKDLATECERHWCLLVSGLWGIAHGHLPSNLKRAEQPIKISNTCVGQSEPYESIEILWKSNVQNRSLMIAFSQRYKLANWK